MNQNISIISDSSSNKQFYLKNKLDERHYKLLTSRDIKHLYKYLIENIKKLDGMVTYVVLDEAFNYLSIDEKNSILKLIKENGKYYCLLTSNIEDTLFSDYLVVLYKNNVAIEGKIQDVFKEEKLLNKIGFKLPFIYDISTQLGYYQMIDKICESDEELIGELWN